MTAYKPGEFWEKSHSSVSSADVDLGCGIHYVGGGKSGQEAKALYRLRQLNAHRTLRKCRLPANPKIFELGSGGGFWVKFFDQFSPSLLVGSDVSATAVDRLRSRYPNHSFISVNETAKGWEEIRQRGPYDLCLAIDVLYHIVDDSSWRLALNCLCENCKPEGWLLVADYFYEQPRESPSVLHVKWRPMQTYLDMLDEYSFQVAHIQPIFYFLNRTVDGPWKDHTGLTAVLLKHMISTKLGLEVLSGLDSVITKFARPMSPTSKMRFLLAKRK
jgi:Methyltransferase domain